MLNIPKCLKLMQYHLYLEVASILRCYRCLGLKPSPESPLVHTAAQEMQIAAKFPFLIGKVIKIIIDFIIYFQQHPLILSVKTENRPGQSSNNPYLAFRRRTEKMQTRKNR